MKKKDYLVELRGLSQDGLKSRIKELQEEKMKLRFKKSSNQLDQKHRLYEVRSRLAQAKTIHSEKARA